MADKQAARERSDQPNIVRLMGRFHLSLVRLAGNRPLANTILELAMMTVLAIFCITRRCNERMSMVNILLKK